MPLRLADGGPLGVFKASMYYEIVAADPKRHEGKWRVSTRSYAYELVAPDGRRVDGIGLCIGILSNSAG